MVTDESLKEDLPPPPAPAKRDRAQKAVKLWDDAEAGGSTSAVVAPGVSAAGGDRFTANVTDRSRNKFHSMVRWKKSAATIQEYVDVSGIQDSKDPVNGNRPLRILQNGHYAIVGSSSIWASTSMHKTIAGTLRCIWRERTTTFGSLATSSSPERTRAS